jgi:hypothetical protein
MADVLSQVLPVVSALAGGGLALVGTALADRRNFRRSREAEQEARLVDAFSKYLEALTELGRVMRTAAERLEPGQVDGVSVVADAAALIETINELVGQVRRQGAIARLVAPRSAVQLVIDVESELAPLQPSLLTALGAGGIEPALLVEAAKRLLTLRDALVDKVRYIQRLPW